MNKANEIDKIMADISYWSIEDLEELLGNIESFVECRREEIDNE